MLSLIYNYFNFRLLLPNLGYSFSAMAPKPRYVSMARDDLAWEESDKETEMWEKSRHKAEIYRAIANLIKKYRPGEAVELHKPTRGRYNIFYA